jgi:hypothetical protein
MNKLNNNQSKLLKEICCLYTVHYLNTEEDDRINKYFKAEDKRIRGKICKAIPKIDKSELDELIYHTMKEVLK